MGEIGGRAVLDRLRRRAAGYLSSGQWSAARTVLESLLQKDPGDVAAKLELANLALRRGRLREHAQLLGECARAFVGVTHPHLRDSQLLPALIRGLHQCGEVVAGRKCLEKFERMDLRDAGVLTEQARLRLLMGDVTAAAHRMGRAMALGIDSPDAYYLQATLCQFTGRPEQADQVLRICLWRWPEFGEAAVALANLRTQSREANQVALWRQTLSRVPDAPHDNEGKLNRAGLESALFKELDDIGEANEAWQALERSNALMRQLAVYDKSKEEAVVAGIIEASRKLEGQAELDKKQGRDGPTPIFIVGMPRSGTTLLDRMLSNHSEIASAGELNDFRRQLRWMTDVPAGGVTAMLEVLRRSHSIDFSQLGARYLAQTQWRAQGRRYYIDKLPINVRMVPFIRRALPQARILHLVRDPMDVCFSNYKAMLGLVSAYSYDQEAMAHYYGLYAKLVGIWHQSMPGAMLDVPYNRLVRDTEATLRQVLDHCGLAWEKACLNPESNLAPVATLGSAQVREPVYTRSIGEWRRYELGLEPLRAALP